LIAIDYPNPNKPVSKLWPVVVGTNPNGTTPPNAVMGGTNHMLDYYAKRKGITVEEFQRRDAIVRAEYAACKYKKDDVVYPFNKATYAKKGMVKVIGLYKSYDEYEDTSWEKSDNAYIVTAAYVDTGESLFCTVNFLQIEEPTT